MTLPNVLRFGLLGAALGACRAQTMATNIDPATHSRSELQRMVREQELPGAQYLVLDAQRTWLDLHVGVTDVATAAPMRRDTLQMAYSVTKVVTAIAAMQLVDEGKLELDAPLSRYWALHPYGESVTIRALLAHTAGVPNPLPLRWFRLPGEPLDRDAALREVLAEHPEPSHSVGARYGYTNVGYWLLEKAVESASGQDYARYVDERIFARVGVPAEAIAFDPDPRRVDAVGHVRRFSPMSLALHLLTPARYWAEPERQWSRNASVRSIGRGYGGLFCSGAALGPVLQDLLLAEPTLLSARARDAMFSEQRTLDAQSTSTTLGWVIGELNGVRYFGKQGGGLGFHGNVRIYPERGLATVLLANRTELTPGPIDARSDALDVAWLHGR